MGRMKAHQAQTDRVGFEAVVREPCRVRHFKTTPVPREHVTHMVDMATYAVSVCDTQAWRFIAVEDPDLMADMREAVLERFDDLALTPGLALKERRRALVRTKAMAFAKAPVCLAVVTLPSRTPAEELMVMAGLSQEEQARLCVRPELQSSGAAVQVLATSAHSLGYAVCWTCAPIIAGERLEELLDIESPERLVALVAIGQHAEQPQPASKVATQAPLTFR